MAVLAGVGGDKDPSKYRTFFSIFEGVRGRKQSSDIWGHQANISKQFAFSSAAREKNGQQLTFPSAARNFFQLLGLFVAIFVSIFGGETGDIQHKHLGGFHHFFNGSLVPDPEPPHGKGVGVCSGRKQEANQCIVMLRAMFTRAATRADRMSRRAARLLGARETCDCFDQLKQYKGELVKRGRDIVEGLIRKASKPNPN